MGFLDIDSHLLEGSKDEDGRLTHTGFSLTQDIGTEDSLRDAFLLDYKRHHVSGRILSRLGRLTL